MRDGLIKVNHLSKYERSDKQWFMVEGGKTAFQCSEDYPAEFRNFPINVDISEDFWVDRQRLELSIPLEYLK